MEAEGQCLMTHIAEHRECVSGSSTSTMLCYFVYHMLNIYKLIKVSAAYVSVNLNSAPIPLFRDMGVASRIR